MKRMDRLGFLCLSACGSDCGTAALSPLVRHTLSPTCVVEEGGDEGAVLEEGVAGGDIFKETLLEQRILEHHRPHLQVHESGHAIEENVVFCLRWFPY